MNKFYFLLLAGLLSVNAFAENKQTVTIDGQAVGKTVKEITFDGDNVILSYSDNTSDTKDMSLVSLAFTYDGTTGIDQVETTEKALQVRYSTSMVNTSALLPRAWLRACISSTERK